jgi:sucrose-6-phosphate hydrolase SacC (GH32 family)
MLFKFKSTAQRGITKFEEKAVSLDIGEDNYKYQAFRDDNGRVLP